MVVMILPAALGCRQNADNKKARDIAYGLFS